MFISPKYADEFKSYLEDKLSKEKIDRLMKYAGSMEMEERYKNLEDKDLMREVAKAKCGM